MALYVRGLSLSAYTIAFSRAIYCSFQGKKLPFLGQYSALTRQKIKQRFNEIEGSLTSTSNEAYFNLK